jgi:hypothetical protein
LYEKKLTLVERDGELCDDGVLKPFAINQIPSRRSTEQFSAATSLVDGMGDHVI